MRRNRALALFATLLFAALISYQQARGQEVYDDDPSPYRVERTGLGVFSTTAYSNSDPTVDGRGIMRTGYRTFEGAVAVDPRIIPLFSVVEIEGLPGYFVALDTGGAIKGKRIDIFKWSRPAALRYGVQRRAVVIITKEGD